MSHDFLELDKGENSMRRVKADFIDRLFRAVLDCRSTDGPTVE